MSDEEAQKTGSSEYGDVGRSIANDRQQLETQVQTVSCQPSSDLASLLEIPAGSIQLNPSESGQPVTFDDTGWSGRSESVASPTSSALAPSAVHRSPFPPRLPPVHQANPCFIDPHLCQLNESSYALLISGGDVRNINFQQTCLRDVCVMHDILAEPVGTIPQHNISVITPRANKTEKEIEDIYSHITVKRPKTLVVYYSGHNITRGTGQPRLDVSICQGDALNLSRLRTFIVSLLPHCSELFIMLDCCFAADSILLPVLPADVHVPNRTHIQWCSSKNGKSYIKYAAGKSIFTLYVISALLHGTDCPNRDENCPLCSKLTRVISQNGYMTWRDLMEYVHDHMRNRDPCFSFGELPQFMINPEGRG